MPQEGFKRKLAAILSADIVCCNRPMGKDKVGTIQLLTEYQEIIAQTKRGQSDTPRIILNFNDSE